MSLVSDAFAEQNEKNPQNTQNPNRLLSGGLSLLAAAAAAAAAVAAAAVLDLLQKWLSEVLPGNVALGSFQPPFCSLHFVHSFLCFPQPLTQGRCALSTR